MIDANFSASATIFFDKTIRTIQITAFGQENIEDIRVTY